MPAPTIAEPKSQAAAGNGTWLRPKVSERNVLALSVKSKRNTADVRPGVNVPVEDPPAARIKALSKDVLVNIVVPRFEGSLVGVEINASPKVSGPELMST
jgi:hypothetical protein